MSLVLEHGTLIDGNGKAIPDAVVVTDNSHIVAAGPRTSTPLPPGKHEVIDASGKTVMPGLWDLHVHLHGQGEANEYARTKLLRETDAYLATVLVENARRILEAGFTSIRDMGAPNDINIDIGRAIADGLLMGPRLIPVATVDMTKRPGEADMHGLKGGNVTGPMEAARAARVKIAMGAEVIHLKATGAQYGQFGPKVELLTMEEMRGAIREAIKLGKRTTTNACSAPGARNAVEAGVQCVEHGEYLCDDPALIEEMAEKQVAFVPTLSVVIAKVNEIQKARAAGCTSGLPKRVEEIALDELQPHRASFQMARKAGVPLPLGTDSGSPFILNGTNARELGLYVDYGMSPMEALEAATRVSAKVMGYGDQVGTIEAGKIADILMVRGDPLQDIRLLEQVRNIELVIQAGKIVVDRRAMSLHA